MTQEEILLRQNQSEPFSHEQVDANWQELAARTSHDEDGYNSMSELGAKVKLLVESDSGDLPPIIEPAYADIAALLADQGSQVTGYIYEVTDASADPEIGAAEVAFYKKKASSSNTLSDYERISGAEITIIQNTPQYNIKKLLEKSDLPITSVAQGGFAIKFDDGKATEIIFDEKQSIVLAGAILQAATRDYVLQLTNTSRTSKVLLANVSSFSYADISENHYKASLVNTIDADELLVNDTYKVELIPNNSTSSLPTEEQVIGNTLELDQTDAVSDVITLDLATFSSCKIHIDSDDIEIDDTTNRPASGKSFTKYYELSTENGTEAYTLPAAWILFGELDASVVNYIAVEYSNYTSAGMRIKAYINQETV